MTAHINALITMCTFFRVPSNPSRIAIQSQRFTWAFRNTITTMVAVIDGVRVVTGDAIKVAPLQKQHQAISRPVNTRKGQHTADLRLFFCLYIVSNPSHVSRQIRKFIVRRQVTFLSSPHVVYGPKYPCFLPPLRPRKWYWYENPRHHILRYQRA